MKNVWLVLGLILSIGLVASCEKEDFDTETLTPALSADGTATSAKLNLETPLEIELNPDYDKYETPKLTPTTHEK